MVNSSHLTSFTNRKLIDGHYLNLPVMSDQGEIVGMVDVLKLTYATLDQVRIHNVTTNQTLTEIDKFNVHDG